MNLRDLRYVLAVAEHRNFGRAAEACHVSQPTLSGQLRKLEEQLGVVLFERTNKWVVPTEAGQQVLGHAARAVEAADAVQAAARAARDPLVGRLRLGIIPTLGPYLLPLALEPIRRACPRLELEIWEDVTEALLDRLASHRLDGALLATAPPDADDLDMILFTEPFLAALPPDHVLAGATRVEAAALAPDLLALHDGHCLGEQVITACGGARPGRADLRASSLETLVNLVAAGYGATLIPGLAAGAMRGRGVVLRPIEGFAARTVRLVARATSARRQALDAVAGAIGGAVRSFG